MHSTPPKARQRPGTSHSKKHSRTRSKQLANAAILGMAGVMVVGLGATFAQQERAFSQNAEARSAYTPAVIPSERPEVIKFAAAGDSITEANSRDVVAGKIGDGSWLYYAQSKGVQYAGGWADGGAQSSKIAEKFKKVEGAEVLVILAGTNDSSNGTPFAETSASISRLVETAGTERVLVSSIPPQNEDPGRATRFNAELEAFATGQGWDWVDASAGLRDGEIYKDGLTNDGVHPTKKGARIIGKAIKEAIIR